MRRGSAVGVARARGRRGPSAAPASSDGAVGPEHRRPRVTVPSPSSSLSRRTQRSARAAAAGSPRPSSRCARPARRRRRTPASQCAATSAPTSSAQRPKTPRTAQVGLPAAVGDEPVDGGAEQLRVAVVGVGAATPGRAGAAPPAPDAGCRRRRRPGRAAARRQRRRRRGRPRSRPLRRGRRSRPVAGGSVACCGLVAQSTRRHLAARDVEAGAGQRRGHVGGDRRGDQHLLGAGDQLGQLVAALGVELGEHVVEDQDRVVAVGAQQVVRRQPQRERERPRLAVAGVALGRQRARACSTQVVAVRADQGDAAVELVARGAAPASASSAVGAGRARPGRRAGSSNDGLYSRARRRHREAPPGDAAS